MGTDSPVRHSRNRQPRGRGLRTTSGCLTCRKRHIKCDEVKPTCGACVKHGKSCEYGPSSNRRYTIHETQPSPEEEYPAESTNQDTQEQHGLNPFDTLLGAALKLPHMQLEKPQSSNIYTSPTNVSYSPHSATSPSIPRPTVDAAAVRWFDLLTTDFNREGLQVPVDLACENNGERLDQTEGVDLTQLTSLQRATQELDRPQSVNLSPGQVSSELAGVHQVNHILVEKQIWQTQEPIDLLPREHFLFEHFVQRVSQWIDLFDLKSHFANLVPHLAVRNAGLMNAVLALASRHLWLNPQLGTQELPNKETALQYYNQALHYLQNAMQYSSYNTSLELLVTTLIISTYEMLDNSSHDWERHLEGVFLIQRSLVIHGESGGLQAAVWWAWLCQDLWAAFREKRKTLTFWTPQKPMDMLSTHELANRVVYIAAKVVNLCSREAMRNEVKSRMSRARELHTLLDNWRRNLTIEFSPLPSRCQDPSYFEPIWIRPPEFGVAVQLYCAARMLLLAHEPTYGELNQHLERQATIQRCVQNICSIAMALKDDASSLMSSQMLFIAGMFTYELRARKAVLELLETYRQRTGWPVKPLGDELQQLWSTNKPEDPSPTFLLLYP